MSAKGSHIARLVFQLIVVLLCAGYIEYVYYADIYPERQVKKAFTHADCTIINKRLSHNGNVITQYRADFLISYNVKGVQYNRWVSGDGLEMLYTTDKASQDKLLAKFNIGGMYSCWYNPLLPQVSVLVAKHNWRPLLPLLIPFTIGLIALFFFLRNLFRLPSVTQLKTRVRTRKKQKK